MARFLKNRDKFKYKAGFTLTEVMLSGAIITLLSLILFEGVAVLARISHENAELLAADSCAWDVAWKVFNVKYKSLKSTLGQDEEKNLETWELYSDMSSEAAKEKMVLHYPGSPAKVYTHIKRHYENELHPEKREELDGVTISVNLEWGPRNNRKRLSNISGSPSAKSFNHPVTIFRSNMERIKPEK